MRKKEEQRITLFIFMLRPNTTILPKGFLDIIREAPKKEISSSN
jgi:hypothetical protein